MVLRWGTPRTPSGQAADSSSIDGKGFSSDRSWCWRTRRCRRGLQWSLRCFPSGTDIQMSKWVIAGGQLWLRLPKLVLMIKSRSAKKRQPPLGTHLLKRTTSADGLVLAGDAQDQTLTRPAITIRIQPLRHTQWLACYPNMTTRCFKDCQTTRKF